MRDALHQNSVSIGFADQGHSLESVLLTPCPRERRLREREIVIRSNIAYRTKI